MPPATRSHPGPAGTSCLTCKRRHKKCDKKRPACDQCSKGGYECLGYVHNKSNGFTYDQPLLSGAGSSPLPSEPSTLTTSPRGDSPWDSEMLTPSDTADILSPGNGAEPHILPGSAHARQDLSSSLAFYNEDAEIFDAFSPTISKTQVAENQLLLSLHSGNGVTAQHTVFATSPILFEIASRMPRSVPTPPDVRSITEYVISRYNSSKAARVDRMINIIYFKPRVEDIEQFHQMAQLILDAKIHDSILEGSHKIHSSKFTRWIEGFEKAVRARLNAPLSAYESQERLNDVLEIFFTKGLLFSAATTYDLFCRTVPNFLQFVYSDPTLWPAQSNPALVSIAHLLASFRFGPAYYALMDITGSMIYGVPQLVDYNTDIELFHIEPHPVEFIDCLPGDFLVILARINALRDRRSSEDWRDIERQLISWEARPRFEPKGLESWKLVAWRALQETWRQTLLMYLYLAVCGLPTDDPRIQASLRQVFQLAGVIRRQDPPASNVNFFSQCLIAGICSRTEKHRRLVRERLGCAAETRLWMFRGPDIIPVLDHLWIGAGSGGQPVTWNDYVHSRRTMLPLSH